MPVLDADFFIAMDSSSESHGAWLQNRGWAWSAQQPSIVCDLRLLGPSISSKTRGPQAEILRLLRRGGVVRGGADRAKPCGEWLERRP